MIGSYINIIIILGIVQLFLVCLTCEVKKWIDSKVSKGQFGLVSIKVVLGIIEFFLFFCLTIAHFNIDHGNLNYVFIDITKIAGPWVAIKIFGGYTSWASEKEGGRATFYLFLIGSIINIALASLVGYLFALKLI